MREQSLHELNDMKVALTSSIQFLVIADYYSLVYCLRKKNHASDSYL